ncbi:MAG: NUDIX domain-containing protein [Candidatus Kuenenbacteria bacterium]
MELIREITEKSLKIGNRAENFNTPYTLRKAARAIVFDKNGKIPIIFDPKHNHHKIPGGGVDKGESLMQTLKREVKEEAGCDIHVIDEIGIVIEYRNKIKILQISYVWLAKLKGKAGEPEFDKEEIAEGHKLKWVSPKEALKLFKNDKPRLYNGHFMWKRDYELLKLGGKMIKNELGLP